MLLGKETRALHMSGMLTPSRDLPGARERGAQGERKGSGKKLVTEDAIFILRYSCVHFSDQAAKIRPAPAENRP